MSIAGHFSRKERSAGPKSQGPFQGELTVHITVLQIFCDLNIITKLTRCNCRTVAQFGTVVTRRILHSL